MSYDINQSQGPYNDGNNQLAGQPALDQPVSPDQVPVVPEEGIWKKYSSHYEFPLSLLMAVMLHVLAVMVVLAYMAIAFYFGSPKPPDLETIVFAGGGGSGDGAVEEFKREIQDEIKTELDPDILKPPPDVIPDIIKKDQFEIEVQKLRPGDKGKGGTGTGGGKGAGVGTGEGDGAGPGKASGARLDRVKRWRINLSYEDPEMFIEKLSNLKIVIGARFNNGRFYIFEDMPSKPPITYKEMTLETFQQFAQKMQRLWMVTHDRNTCESFAIGANLSERPVTVFIFIPQDMELAILAKEEAHHGLKEAEIKKRKIVTKFDVRRTGSGWDVRVTGTQIDPTLNYENK
jgi:hypothetical protein